ncbi:MAG: hypothetical protein LJE83_04425 [Gammaproteobacteria bacterium]|nr:hypothetical protein [Gammaproteobacteria bacterium]
MRWRSAISDAIPGQGGSCGTLYIIPVGDAPTRGKAINDGFIAQVEPRSV